MEADLKKIAQSRGGDCLGASHTNSSRKKFLWRCAEGHTWEALADSVKRGTWCPICSRNKQKKTIDEMRGLAKQRDGECLSQVYVNAHTKLKWKCKNGHIFKSTPSKVKQGRWCRECGNRRAAFNRRISMKKIQMIAKSRNGKCLSDSYDPGKHLKWQCEFGHIWEASIYNIKPGSWCPICGYGKGGRKSLSIEEMRDIAASRGGKCLSARYNNVDSKLKWKCENGHVWMARPASIKKGHWCPDCAGVKKLDIEQVQKIACERGGRCVSTKYFSNHQKLKWQCAEGHTWNATYANIAWGGWCPECSSGLGERICQAHFEQMFGKKFPKSRPSWLINQDGYQMELDGYCKELALAFEHQGIHHFQQIDYFHSSEAQFHKRQRDDSQKRFLCKKNNVTLIEVPQIPESLKLPIVKKYILKQCKEVGYEIPVNAEHVNLTLNTAYSPNTHEKIKLIREVASTHGGTCLSSAYFGMKVKLRFRCKNSHEWETTPDVILKGHWCPKCSSLKRGFIRRLTIGEMHQLAKERGGRCLSQTYVNANTHLLWECSKGHQWRAIPNSIKRGSWCLVCSRDRRSRKVGQPPLC